MKPLVSPFPKLSPVSMDQQAELYSVLEIKLDSKCPSFQADVDGVVHYIRINKLSIPLVRYFLTEEDIVASFESLVDYEGDWRAISHRRPKGHNSNMWLPTLFRGIPLHIVSKKNDWWNIDVITDYFTEYERLVSKKDYSQSPMETWENNKALRRTIVECATQKIANARTIRDNFFYQCKELALFRVTRAKSVVVEILGPETRGLRWLDISAGWGDRLIAACSLDMDYLGFDPNEGLRHGHSEIIRVLGNNENENHRRREIHYLPFETEAVSIIARDTRRYGRYNLVFTSPPFYILERYNGLEQSVNNYPAFDQWMVKFLFSSIQLAWENLTEDGFLAINIADIRGCNMVVPMQLFIEDECHGSNWEGIIAHSGRATCDAPGLIYVWRKNTESADNDTRVLWDQSVSRSLAHLYPVLHSMYHNNESS